MNYMKGWSVNRDGGAKSETLRGKWRKKGKQESEKKNLSTKRLGRRITLHGNDYCIVVIALNCVHYHYLVS